MSQNFDASQVGVPFVRAHKIEIHYPDNGQMPWATIYQSLAVKLADGVVRKIEDLPEITRSFDMANDGADAIPLVSPVTGAALGPSTSLNQVMLDLLAVVRQEQTRVVE